MQKTQFKRVFGGVGEGGGDFIEDKVNRAAADAHDNAVKGDQNE